MSVSPPRQVNLRVFPVVKGSWCNVAFVFFIIVTVKTNPLDLICFNVSPMCLMQASAANVDMPSPLETVGSKGRPLPGSLRGKHSSSGPEIFHH